jgi:hydrogenase expression/formation protein HypD
MRYISEYRDAKLVQMAVEEIEKIVTRPWAIMEICGGQTHAIMRYGLDQLLPENIELIHGPGCPVCVTSLELIDKALEIAKMEQVIFTSYGDMLRVPGSKENLFNVRASGGDVRVVYSPLDAIKIAQQNPDKQVVFFAIGFETTAPANAMSVIQAKALNLKNYSLLVSHVCVPPALKAILGSPNNRVQGVLAAGHVCSVMGYWEYPPIAQKFNIPIVVTGFEPLDIARGVLMTVKQLESELAKVENAYPRAVTYEGNRSAIAVIQQVFRECDRKWRGIGTIPKSGWCLQPDYTEFDAEIRFSVEQLKSEESPVCIAGSILQGLKKPIDCPAFGTSCTPEQPLGATMVSSEGACAAYYRYARNAEEDQSLVLTTPSQEGYP